MVRFITSCPLQKKSIVRKNFTELYLSLFESMSNHDAIARVCFYRYQLLLSDTDAPE